MLPLACSLLRKTDRPSPSFHCISLLFGMSEKTSFFAAGSHTGPSVNFMPPASFFTFAPGATSDFGSSAEVPARPTRRGGRASKPKGVCSWGLKPVFSRCEPAREPASRTDQGNLSVEERFWSSSDFSRSSGGMVTNAHRSHFTRTHRPGR